MHVEMTFEPEFDELYQSFVNDEKKAQYLNLDGIGVKKVDVGQMSHDYFTKNLADTSVDMNANANEELSANNYQAEVTKGVLKLEGYYLIWRYMKKRFGLERANEALSAIWDGSLYFHDASGHGVQVPYSYHGGTPIIAKVDGKIVFTTMDKLFEKYQNNKLNLPDREVISLFTEPNTVNGINLVNKLNSIEIFDGINFVAIKEMLRHLKHNELLSITTEDGRTTVVTQDHPVLLNDGSTKLAKDITNEDVLKTGKLNRDLIRNTSYYVNPKFAYIIGMLLADGHVSQSKATGTRFFITQKAEAVQERIKQYLDELKINWNIYKSRPDRIVLFGKYTIIPVLKSMGLYGKSFEKRLPENVLQWDMDSIIGLICGLVDGEGSFAGNSATIRVSNYGLASQIYEVINLLGADRLSLRTMEYKKSEKGFKNNSNVVFCVSFVPLKKHLAYFNLYSSKLDNYVYNYENNKYINDFSQQGKVKKIIEVHEDKLEYVYDITVDNHIFYSNGLIQHNCFAFSTTPIMIEGRPYGQLHSLPPKRSDSFIAQVIEVCMDMSQEFAGAVAPSDLIVNYCYYSKKELKELLALVSDLKAVLDPEQNQGHWFLLMRLIAHFFGIDLADQKTRKKFFKDAFKMGFGDVDTLITRFHYKKVLNDFQKFVHVMNNKFRVSGQSPFTNVSIFDRPNLKKLFEHVPYIDGSNIDVEYVMTVQKLIAEWFSKGDPKTGLPYRFPVMTANISIDENNEPLDNDFISFIAETNTDMGVYNIYASEGSKIAMCPLAGEEEVIIRNHKGIYKSPIGNLGQKGKEEYELLYKGEFIKGKFIRVPYTNFIEITLSNGHKVITTDNHLNYTQRGTIPSKDLDIGDMLPFNLKAYEGHGGDYGLGYLVGAYCGDGTRNDKNITFCLNPTTKEDVFIKLKNYCENVLGASTTLTEKENVKLLSTRSLIINSIIDTFIVGNNALNKGLNPAIFGKSIDFRQGLLDGYLATDGGNKDRIYTSSKRMVDDLSALVASLGNVTNIKIEDNREGRLGTNTNYCVKIYNKEYLKTRNYRDVWQYSDDDDIVWFYIIDLKEIKKPYNTNAYCFEVNTEESLFQLANGLITHNCRYINDMERMKYRSDSFGNGGLNIGSHRIVTVNFPKLALDSGGDMNEFIHRFDYLMGLVKDLLLVHREEILRRRVEKGFLKFFKPLQWFSMNMFFSTIGITGLYEMCHYMGMPMEEPTGQTLVAWVLQAIENYADKFSEETGYSFNSEEIPGESAVISLAKKDKITHGNKAIFELYSNQYLPLIADFPLAERVELTAQFMNMVSGGGIFHMNIQDRIPTAKKMEKIIRMLVKKGIIHFAVNYGFGICENGHTSVIGNQPTCPFCGEPIKDYYTRIIGYFTKTSSWNEVRKNYDFPQRKFA